LLATICVGLLLSAALLVVALWAFQAKLIYPAQRYGARGLEGLPQSLQVLRDPGDAQSVVGFYVPPVNGGVPERLWLLFNGNAETAMRFEPLVRSSATAEQGFLLVEYPGYGARSGKPSPEALLTGTEQTLRVLSDQLGTTPQALEARSSVLGYSLGSAAALQYAVQHPVQRIVLLAPFTSMLAMAERVVGSPLCHLLQHRYDNVAALSAVQAKRATPLFILHGDRDNFIPPSMGQSLASLVPGSHFELVAGAGHGDVVDVAAARLQELLVLP